MEAPRRYIDDELGELGGVAGAFAVRSWEMCEVAGLYFQSIDNCFWERPQCFNFFVRGH